MRKKTNSCKRIKRGRDIVWERKRKKRNFKTTDWEGGDPKNPSDKCGDKKGRDDSSCWIGKKAENRNKS